VAGEVDLYLASRRLWPVAEVQQLAGGKTEKGKKKKKKIQKY